MSYFKYPITSRNLLPGVKTVLYSDCYRLTANINSWCKRKPQFRYQLPVHAAKKPRVQAALKLGFIWSSETREKVNIDSPFMISCFLGGALSTLSRVLASSNLPVELTDNSRVSKVIVTDNKISSKVITTDNNFVRCKTLVAILYSLSQNKPRSAEIMRKLNGGQEKYLNPETL